jgi:hypothetical protein
MSILIFLGCIVLGLMALRLAQGIGFAVIGRLIGALFIGASVLGAAYVAIGLLIVADANHQEKVRQESQDKEVAAEYARLKARTPAEVAADMAKPTRDDDSPPTLVEAYASSCFEPPPADAASDLCPKSVRLTQAR